MSLAIKMGLALAILAMLSGIGAGIYTAGKRATRAEYAERDNKALKDAYAERDKALAEKSELELRARKDTQAAEDKANKEITDAYEDRDRALADIDSGKLRLRNLARSCASKRGESRAGETGTAAAETAEAAADRRAKEDAGFLVRFAAERDEVAIERNECVEIAVKDRQRQ